MILVHRERGENRIAIGLGANGTMSVEEVARAEEEIAKSDILLTQFETNAAAIQEFVRLGRKYNKTIMMNPAPFCEMPENIFEGVDYLTPNETEAAYFSGLDKGRDNRRCAQGRADPHGPRRQERADHPWRQGRVLLRRQG